ncbi:DUF1573 domain-containing protein [Flavobacterium sp.]|uniref:DUF1573 domain-containing protein n=1 Tax=Flavobacterium sp. TaxID=239 RepID=UPI003753019D
MKIIKISILALTLGLMSFTINPNIKNESSKVVIASPLAWKAEVVEVGEIPQGTPKAIQFEFKNTSDKAVIITNVKPACGCTAADYTKEPIAPGKTGFVKATYNAAAAGSFTKTVTVTTSAEETPKVLTFKGTVVVKA